MIIVLRLVRNKFFVIKKCRRFNPLSVTLVRHTKSGLHWSLTQIMSKSQKVIVTLWAQEKLVSYLVLFLQSSYLAKCREQNIYCYFVYLSYVHLGIDSAFPKIFFDLTQYKMWKLKTKQVQQRILSDILRQPYRFCIFFISIQRLLQTLNGDIFT